jgi:hypothetical protein
MFSCSMAICRMVSVYNLVRLRGYRAGRLDTLSLFSPSARFASDTGANGNCNRCCSFIYMLQMAVTLGEKFPNFTDILYILKHSIGSKEGE